ncbi:3-oxoacyl-[acyl-carrier-protein] reductase FabG [compost metagenome]
MKPLEGKTAIVTGSSRGIGRAIAMHLAALGANIVINYTSRPDQALETVEEVARQGVEAISVQADLGHVEDVKSLFAAALAAFGRIDILINNAGIMRNKPLAEVTEEDFDQHFSINVKGTYFACQQALQHMREGGSIINFSTSVIGQMFPAYSVYAGTKGAVEQFTRQLAKEFGPRRITINAIAPGPVNTELFTADKTEEQIQAVARLNAFGRIGEPEDIANVIEFLVSDQARWVTGQTLRVNGGFI